MGKSKFKQVWLTDFNQGRLQWRGRENFAQKKWKLRKND